MRFRTLAAAGALAGLVPSSACFGRPTYGCDQASQCVVEGVQGHCEADGLCSYDDGTCPSGRRYSPYAGARAETCVDATVGSTAMTGADDDASSEASGSDTGGSTTGCTSACPEPGAQLWSTRAVELGAGRAAAVAVGSAGVVVTGEVTVDDRIELVVATFEPVDGEQVGALPWPSAAGGPDRGLGIAALPAGDLVVAGSETTEAGHERGVLFRTEASGAVAWTRRWDTLEDDVLAGIAVHEARIVAVGSSGARAIVVEYAEDGAEVRSRVFDPPDGAVGATLLAVAQAAGAGAWVAGAVQLGADGSDRWVRRLNADGGVLLDLQLDDPSQAGDVAFAVAPLPRGDALVGGVASGDAWLARIDTAGALAFSRAVQDGGSVHAIATSPDGKIIAAGHADVGDGRDAWVAAFDPSAELVWAQTHDTADLDDEAHGLALENGVAYVAGYGADESGDAIWVAAYAL